MTSRLERLLKQREVLDRKIEELKMNAPETEYFRLEYHVVPQRIDRTEERFYLRIQLKDALRTCFVEDTKADFLNRIGHIKRDLDRFDRTVREQWNMKEDTTDDDI